MKRNVIVGGTLIFRIPYDGRAKFDWWLDAFGHDVLVECMGPWKELYTDIHRIGMGPKFTHAEARQIAEALCHKIITNLEFVIQHRQDENLRLESCHDNMQLPLYRKWARDEERRRFIEVGLLADAFKDDDDDDDAPDNTFSADHVERAEEELRSIEFELIEEIGPFTRKELKEKWRLV